MQASKRLFDNMIFSKAKIKPRDISLKSVDNLKITQLSVVPFLPNFSTKLKDKSNLHKSLTKMFVLAQIFGYLPVQGVTGPDHSSVHFTWKSFRVLYTFLTIVGAFFISCMQLSKIIRTQMDLMEVDRLCFNFSGCLSGILLLVFAKNWPKLMKDWNTVDVSMLSYGWPVGLNRKINTLMGVFMGMALVEHLLIQSRKLVAAFKCKSNGDEAITYFLSNMSFSNTFSVVEYNIFTGILMQVINLQLTFSWTFLDLFIMVLSTVLAYRFQQLTMRIQSAAEAKLFKIESDIIWKHLREDYNKLCKLCRKVDDEISCIVLLAFSNDLFFILTQLFNTLKPMSNDLERVYFYFSFGLLITRTICLCLYGAKVNDESKRPLIILNSVHSDVYNLEIQRFVQQIGTTEVAITGRSFFSITRGLILSIAGAIVTYELVLIQFNDNLLKDTTKHNVCPIFV